MFEDPKHPNTAWWPTGGHPQQRTQTWSCLLLPCTSICHTDKSQMLLQSKAQQGLHTLLLAIKCSKYTIHPPPIKTDIIFVWNEFVASQKICFHPVQKLQHFWFSLDETRQYYNLYVTLTASKIQKYLGLMG